MRGEVELRRGDDTTVLVELSSTIVRIASGELRSLVVLRDLSAQKRRERELAEITRRLRIFVEQAPAAMAMFDLEMRYIGASRSWLDHHRLSSESVVGRSHYELVPDLPARWREVHRRVLEGATESGEEEPFPRADGSTDWVTWRAQPWHDGDGRIGGAILLTEVVTRRKLAELSARQSDARYRNLVESSPSAVFVNRGGLIDYANAAAVALFGASSAGELLGKPVLERISPSFRDEIGRRLETLAKGGRVPLVETRFVRLDGTERDVEAVATRFEDDRGSGVQVVARDIAERKQLAGLQRLESIGRLAGGIAHDFNNLLMVILGSVDLVRGELGSARSSTLAMLDDVEQAARRAAELTKQLLAFARKQLSVPVRLSLGEQVRAAESLLRRVLGSPVRLELALGQGVPVVRADPAQIDQVLLNLAANARDAMPGGGRLVIETHAETLALPTLVGTGTLAPGRYAVLTVTDTGAGIPPDVRAQIFEPFFTTKPEGRGTGLGLSVVFGIVTQVGGAIALASEVDRGTTFSLYFPAAEGGG
jgi:PAS domain S-box-containing protein